MRHTLAYLVTVSLISATSSGCFLYFENDGDDDCAFGGGQGGSAEAPAVGQRNPFTGQCEFFGGGPGPFPCDDRCGPCPADAEEAPNDAPSAAMPSWGFCESACTPLQEAACLTSAGCRGVYDVNGAYQECWSIDMSGPIRGGACEGLDAWECSRHDDCRAVHDSSCDGGNREPGFACGTGEFVRCESEPAGCYDDGGCPDGFRCTVDDVCGDPGQCDPATGCDSACYGYCVPDSNPGECYGPIECDLPPPGCPPNSVPGRQNGCYTGQCIPVEQCEDPPPAACPDVTDEAVCIARAECSPLYEGIDCSCDSSGCQCADWEFRGCSDPANP